MSAAAPASATTAHTLRAALAFGRAGARQEQASIPAWFGRVVFYMVIVFIFSRLWEVVFAERLLSDGRFSAAALVWYLALNEWATLSTPQIWMDIEADVRSGDIVHWLSRPIPYVVAKLAEALGALFPRLAVMGAFGLGWAAILAGGLPPDTSGLLWALPIVVLASILQLLCLTIVGLTALWLEEAGPVLWIWQKSNFLLGGLMIPLELYPTAIREIAWWTPFAPMLNGLGRLAFGGPAEQLIETISALLFWSLAACLVLAWQFNRGVRALEAGGG